MSCTSKPLYNQISSSNTTTYLGEELLGEAGADLADALVLLRLGVVARQEEGAVPPDAGEWGLGGGDMD